MKTSSVFWGIFLIVAGLLFFLNQFDAFNIDYSHSKYLWALVIIGFGIMLLKIPDILKRIVAGLSGAILAFAVLGLFSFKSCNTNNIDLHIGKNIEYNEVSFEMDSNVVSANLKIDGVAGKIIFDGTTESLIFGSGGIVNSSVYYEDNYPDGKRAEITIDLVAGRSGKKFAPNISLNPKIAYTIDFEAAATKIDADLSKYQIEEFSLESAASSVDIKIGSQIDTVSLIISSALSNVRISIPKEYACKIESDHSLSSLNFDNRKFKGFSANFHSDNYGKTHKIINIEVNSGLSKLDISRY